MEHRFRRKWFENTIFCIAVVKLACTVYYLFKTKEILKPEVEKQIDDCNKQDKCCSWSEWYLARMSSLSKLPRHCMKSCLGTAPPPRHVKRLLRYLREAAKRSRTKGRATKEKRKLQKNC